MNQDISRIRNVCLISFSAPVLAGVVCFFVFSLKGFLSVLVGGIINYILFVITLVVYYRIIKIKSRAILSYLIIIFAGKLIVSAVAFFLVYWFDYLEMLYFLFSYLIFFTIFFNIEIFLMYKKILFYRK